MGVMDVSEQGARRTALIEENSRRSFFDRLNETRKKIISLKREKGIPDDTCICGKKIEPERLQLGLLTCQECAFNGKFCILHR